MRELSEDEIIADMAEAMFWRKEQMGAMREPFCEKELAKVAYEAACINELQTLVRELGEALTGLRRNHKAYHRHTREVEVADQALAKIPEELRGE